MIEPTSISPGSIMPAYEWMADNDLDKSYTLKKINAMRSVGVPYPEMTEQAVLDSMDAQATQIAKRILKDIVGEEYEAEEVTALKEKEVIALIAYLQRLGSDIHKSTIQENQEKP